MDWKDSEYLDEKAFEQYLLGQGVTPEQLEKDLGDHLTLSEQPYAKACQIFVDMNGNNVRVYAEDVAMQEKGIRITEWLNSIPIETLMYFWGDTKERNKIKGLMRYPGAYHEWLMLAAIPMLKVMEISMEEIMQYRTLTDECCFFIDDTQYWHGREGSTTMHNDLFMEIGNAYLECAQRQVHHTFPVLRKYLRRFAEKYYCNRTEYMPEALKRLIGM